MDGRRKGKRWVKYDGIGPVDESGMPLASRSSVNSPRDWYRNMFQQIHSKLPESIAVLFAKGDQIVQLSLKCQASNVQAEKATISLAVKQHFLPSKWFGLPKKPPTALPAQLRMSSPPIEELLEKELQQLSEQLDKDIRAIEIRQLALKVIVVLPPTGINYQRKCLCVLQLH
uniref:Uncharacterized protein n=1 Tax=Sphaerodactylus townsendi TaxID=933632 RepID=A0ACB8EXX3_9SAUR